MKFLNIKFAITFFLFFYIHSHAGIVYTVEKSLIPDYQLSLHNTVYNRISRETQTFDNEWKNKQKTSFNYDNEWKLTGYSVVSWNSSVNSWTDSMYCMFFYNSRKQPMSYQVSPINADTVTSVIYKEYYFYDDFTTKLKKIITSSKNSDDLLVLSSEEEHIYNQNSDIDSVTTTGYDEEEHYIWRITTEKVHYVSDTMYSISENTSYKSGPNANFTNYNVEHQYYFSTDGKMKMQGECLLPGLITERTLYSYREADGLPEMELSQNIDLLNSNTYTDTSRITYSYSSQDSLVIKTATTEVLSSQKWIPVSRIIDTYSSHGTTAQKKFQVAAESPLNFNVYLTHSSHPALCISSAVGVKAIELFSLNGALMYKEKMVRFPDKIVLDLSNSKAANYCGPIIARIKLENGVSWVQRVFQIRQ